MGFRGEYINDKDGLITGVADNNITALTLSGNIHMGPVTVIPEFRIDTAREETFTDKDGKPTSGSPALIFAAIYSF